MPGGRKPGKNYKGPKRSRNLSPEERKKSNQKLVESIAESRREIARERQAEFFDHLADSLKLPVALKKAKIPRATYYKWMRRDKVFKKRVEAFWQAAVAHVEAIAYQIATKGVRKRHYNKDCGFYFNREYSPELIKFILRGRKPHIYGNRLGIQIDTSEAVKIVLPHNNRDKKPIAPCGAAVEAK